MSAQPPAGPFPDPIDKLVPFGSICTLSGASGVGKTAFIAGMVRTIYAGGTLFGYQTHTPPAIGILVCDRPWRDHAAWFEKAGCPEIPHLSLRDLPGYNWDTLRMWQKIPAEFGRLLDLLNLPPGALLIVDPLPLFIPGRLIDYKDVAIGMGHLDHQLQKRHLTMLGVFHVSKQKSNKNDRYMRPQDRILGSSALIGYSETAFYLLSPDEAEKRHYEFGAIAHQLPPLTLEYKRTDTGLFAPAHELDHFNYEEAAFACFPPEGETIASSVILATIAKTAKCSERTAYGYIRGFVAEGRVRRVGKGLYERARPA